MNPAPLSTRTRLQRFPRRAGSAARRGLSPKSLDAPERAPMGQQVRILGLDDYQLSPVALRRLGEESVRFSVQLRGLKLSGLLPLQPKQRDLKLRAALKQQFKQL